MIVLITGARYGFGEAAVRRIVAGGHRVIAAARRVDRLSQLGKELGSALLPLAMDVSDLASITAALATNRIFRLRIMRLSP